MQYPRRPSPASTYESQAARWKQGFKPGAVTGSARQTDLEGALVSELCSSIGSSSFPPREVLQKLLRYLHTLDHEYVCELLDDKFQNPLWQVQAKAVSVLDAILKSSEAEFYKRHYYERIDLIEAMCRARKDMLRARADKVYKVLRDYSPPPAKAEPERPFMHTSPVISSTQPPADLMSGFDSPRSNSEPLPGPAPVPVSAFSFIGGGGAQEPDVAPEPSPTASPTGPGGNGSAFSFLNAGGATPSPIPVATVYPPVGPAHSPPAQPAKSAFAFIASTPSPTSSPPVQPTPAPSAPPLPQIGGSGFSFLNQGAVAPSAVSSVPVVSAVPSAPEPPSAFGFLQAGTIASAPVVPPVVRTQPRHDVFDSLPPPTPVFPGASLGPGALLQEVKQEEAPEPEEPVDPIHDAFEGLSMEPAHPLDSVKMMQQSSVEMAPYQETQTPVARENIREVILEVEVPPGPMGIMLDRTITDMVVIESFIPLPSGEKGYLDLHPAICPGCALVSINSIHVEDRGIDEVGPILASLGSSPKLLRFKKLMSAGRTVNPSTMTMPYVPPPPIKEEIANSNEDEEDEVTSYDDSQPGEDFVSQLTEFDNSLSGIEQQLDALILKESKGLPVGDRKNTLAQMHGNVERIQTQGIDSVIFGPNPPPNYEEVKRYRSSLVRKAEAIAFRIHQTIQGEPGSMPVRSPSLDATIVMETSTASVVDPPLGISQLQGASGFRFMNPTNQDDVPTDRNSGSSYGFSFLRDGAAEAQSTASQAPTSPSSSFGFLQNSGVSAGATSPAEAPATVFAGLNVRGSDGGSLQSDPLSVSSHGRPMGIQDLSVSTSSMTGHVGLPGGASMAPSSTMATAGTAADASYSAFGFLSTNGPSDTLTSSSSSAELASSPTAFRFLQGNSSAMGATASSTSSMPPLQDSMQPPETGSVFSFISN